MSHPGQGAKIGVGQAAGQTYPMRATPPIGPYVFPYTIYETFAQDPCEMPAAGSSTSEEIQKLKDRVFAFETCVEMQAASIEKLFALIEQIQKINAGQGVRPIVDYWQER